MKKQKLYDLIKQLLTDYPQMRDSDKVLIWEVWGRLGFVTRDLYWGSVLTSEKFWDATSPESIRRCRQKIQEKHPELRSSKKVQEAKDRKEATKSTFIYREPVQTQLV
jgi:hypothetical protein